MKLSGLISGVMGGAAKGYGQYAEGELKKQQELDLRKQLMAAEEEKALRIDEIKRNRDIADIPRKGAAETGVAVDRARALIPGEVERTRQVGAAQTDVEVGRAERMIPVKADETRQVGAATTGVMADRAPVLAAAEAQGEVAKTQVPGFLDARQSQTDAGVSTSQKAVQGSQVALQAQQIEKYKAEIRKIDADIASGGGATGATRDRLTTIVNSANATIKSLQDGGRGATKEAKEEWQRQYDAAVALRNQATRLLQSSLNDRGGTPNPSAAPASGSRPPLESFNR